MGTLKNTELNTLPVHKGYTMVELIAVIAIIAGAVTAFGLVMTDNSNRERMIVHGEAQNLSAWLKNEFSLAAREKNDFTITVGRYDEGPSRLKTISVRWKNRKNASKVEIYEMRNAKLEYDGTPELNFSGKWYTLTPAATFTVKSAKYPEIRYYVTVSGAGYISVKER
ncbi:MAG: prepilin-type N-terminal cleavage/methylation domain-containing protein [Synergistes sp.]|nr:prepilin-type N-terminal cleavage/methylation domain-containing protein [Synergistes sp.]